MTEAEWLASDNLRLVLKQLRRRPGDRKLRLFACACYRQIWGSLDPRYRKALEAAELYADGRASSDELAAVRTSARTVHRLHGIYFAYAPEPTFADVANAVNYLARRADGPPFPVARTLLREILNHIFGNPFRPPPPRPDLPVAAEELAAALYAGEPCHFALHDALLEAGHSDLAEHFREAGHPKGCWALDLILGKS